MKNVIVNADDYGARSSINKAVVDLFDAGILNSATLMANMPGFDEAVELAHKHKITNKIGAHLVLTEGDPLTPEIKSIPCLFDMKQPRGLLIKKLFILNKNQQKMIFNEYSAQIEKIKKSGIPISHFDTHEHMHEMWGVMQVIIELRKIYQIPSIRILNNLNVTQSYKYFYRRGVNSYLKVRKINFSDYFGSQEDFVAALENTPAFINNKTMEVMVHPNYNNEGKLIDIFPGMERDFSFLKH
jgi:predicted glycoside hydrolase/deacetylase ChbG (UPF0249 family)